MTEAMFNKFARIAYEQAGIALSSEKQTLVSSRVGKRLRKLGLKNENEYYKILKADETGKELVQFLDVISTNFTNFFRERDHFEHFEKAMTIFLKSGDSRLRIWCAASSSGEEPYTIAMTVDALRETFPMDVKILATDISTKVLQEAIAGQYPEENLKPLSKLQRTKYFTNNHRNRQNNRVFQVSSQLQEMITFRRLNLNKPPFPMQGPLQFIFCRNVMIYFDKAVRHALITEIEKLLAPGGILYIGHTETLTGVKHGLEVLMPSVYRKPMH